MDLYKERFGFIMAIKLDYCLANLETESLKPTNLNLILFYYILSDGKLSFLVNFVLICNQDLS